MIERAPLIRRAAHAWRDQQTALHPHLADVHARQADAAIEAALHGKSLRQPGALDALIAIDTAVRAGQRATKDPMAVAAAATKRLQAAEAARIAEARKAAEPPPPPPTPLLDGALAWSRRNMYGED